MRSPMLSILLSCQGIPADKPLKFPDEEETGDSGGAGECQPDACSGYLLVNPEDETEGTCISFADQAEEAGLTSGANHAGASIVDYDQDGLADIYLLNYGSGSVNQLFHNNVGGVFEEIASSVGLDVGGDNWDAIFADYDDDNDLDLLTVGDSGTALLKNSAGQFASLSSSKGIADSEPAAAAAWIGSGFLVAGDNGTRLYEYEGSDRFSTDPETSAESAGLDDPGTGSAISLADYDGDGDDDIYLANTTGQNRLFKNLGDGTYQSVEEEAGAVELGNDASTDVNWITLPGDAFPSVFVADYEGNNHFYRNQGDRTFVDQAKDFGLQDPGYTTVSAWAENFINGAPALFLGRWNEEDWDEEDKEPNLLYIPVTNNSGEVTDFENAAHSAGVNDTGQTLDAGWLDYDNDGYLDLLVILYDGGLRLYRNESHEVQLCDE